MEIKINLLFEQFIYFGEAIMASVNTIVALTQDLPENERVPQVLDKARKQLGTLLWLWRQSAGKGMNLADAILLHAMAIVAFCRICSLSFLQMCA